MSRMLVFVAFACSLIVECLAGQSPSVMTETDAQLPLSENHEGTNGLKEAFKMMTDLYLDQDDYPLPLSRRCQVYTAYARYGLGLADLESVDNERKKVQAKANSADEVPDWLPFAEDAQVVVDFLRNSGEMKLYEPIMMELVDCLVETDFAKQTAIRDYVFSGEFDRFIEELDSRIILGNFDLD